MENGQLKEPEESVAELTFGILSEDVNSEVNTDVNLSSLSNISETSVTVDASHVNNERNSEVNTDVNLSSLSNLSETSVTVDTSQVSNETGTDVTDGINAEVVTDGLNTGTSLVQPNLLPENLVLVETSKG